MNGSTIAEPDYAVDSPDPILLKAGEDLRDALLFIVEDSDLCFDARAISALCGCPVAENSCFIWEGSGQPCYVSRRPEVLTFHLFFGQSDQRYSSNEVLCSGAVAATTRSGNERSVRHEKHSR